MLLLLTRMGPPGSSSPSPSPRPHPLPGLLVEPVARRGPARLAGWLSARLRQRWAPISCSPATLQQMEAGQSDVCHQHRATQRGAHWPGSPPHRHVGGAGVAPNWPPRQPAGGGEPCGRWRRLLAALLLCPCERRRRRRRLFNRGAHGAGQRAPLGSGLCCSAPVLVCGARTRRACVCQLATIHQRARTSARNRARGCACAHNQPAPLPLPLLQMRPKKPVQAPGDLGERRMFSRVARCRQSCPHRRPSAPAAAPNVPNAICAPGPWCCAAKAASISARWQPLASAAHSSANKCSTDQPTPPVVASVGGRAGSLWPSWLCLGSHSKQSGAAPRESD